MIDRDKRFAFFVIEDSRGDFVLIEDYLNEQFTLPSVTRAKTFREAQSIFHLENISRYNCILLDLSLPDKSGKDLLMIY